MNIKVDEYISKKEKWSKELKVLRAVFADLPVDETIKWGSPVYVFNGKNIVGLSAFKNYCGLWFFQGALLKDKYKFFINAQEGKTKAMLQWRFNSIDEINTAQIKEYVLEAIENVKLGNEIKPTKSSKPVLIPEELQQELNTNKELKISFDDFSLSKQREYAAYISEAKRVSTKLNRLEKIIPMIISGVGLHDKYKNC
ncbi:MAG: YdeI/OmpD-associated family protein [Flavobacteriales bacterium]